MSMSSLRSARGYFAIVLALAASACAAAPDAEGEDDEGVDGSEPISHRDDPVGNGTVADALSASCSTSSVAGLSKQIIAEGNCVVPGAYSEVPSRPNVAFNAAVFPYLETPARDALVAALDANPNRALTVTSMLRTIAQQYLLYRWYQTGRCGIGLAAKPGASNHETGLAFDTSEYSSWKSALTSRGFHWFGSQDPPHFDFVGAGATSYKGVDVEAFQRLWNRNHPEDPITEDGLWGGQTEARMKKAPAAGFAIGAQCGAAPSPGAPPPACTHALCAEGASLEATCDTCATKICAADAYCCTTQWDRTCVNEVASICALSCAP